MVSGVSGPKFPKKTHRASTPWDLRSPTAFTASASVSTQMGHSYSPGPYAAATALRRRWERAMGKQLRLTETRPNLTSGILFIIVPP